MEIAPTGRLSVLAAMAVNVWLRGEVTKLACGPEQSNRAERCDQEGLT